VDQIVSNLRKDDDFYKVIEIKNLKHAGFYLGTEEKGKIFEYDLSGWHMSEEDYVIKGKLEKTPDNLDEWNWKILKEYRGHTYVSPESLYNSLTDYENKYDYFKKGSYDLLCNNCQDFLKWSLDIISISGRLTPKSTL